MGISSEDLLKDAGIIAGTTTTIITALWALGRGIFKKGEDYANLRNQIKNLQEDNMQIKQDNMELWKKIYTMKEKIDNMSNNLQYIRGQLDIHFNGGPPHERTD